LIRVTARTSLGITALNTHYPTKATCSGSLATVVNTNANILPDTLNVNPVPVQDATAVDTFAQGHYSIRTLPDRLVLQPQTLRLQNAKNIMTSNTITTYNQWQLRPLVCMASPLPLFCVVLRRNLLMCLATPGSASDSTSVCPWLWSGEMLPEYWPVCEFDLTLRVLFQVAAFNILITITAYHLPLQCINV